ncbi:MAG: penicillin-binding protein 2 [Thermoleophilaceae bacterium]
MSPQLALRVAVIGGVALALFAIIFFRLWYLQVLSGDQYLAEANDNRVREVTIQAPRGEIVDREGTVLVENRPSTVLKVSPKDLPERQETKTRLYDRLADLTGQSRREIRTSVREQLRAQPFAAATVKSDVGEDTVAYILENQSRFPGVEVQNVHLREYPHDELGAHLFGTVGEVTEEQLEDERYRGVDLGDRVGQSGIEYSYDRFLRGENGATRLQVDALGNLRQEIGRREPEQGRQLRLTLDLDVQEAGQRALGDQRGAFVVMDARTGEMVALGSSPSFDPNSFAKVFRQSDYERLVDPANGAPLQNRAIAGLYPTGSVFKPITAVAGLMGGLIGPDTVINDGGSITVGDREFENDRGTVHGAVDLRRALEVSSDVYFYLLGRDSWDDNLIQRWSRQLGLGHTTGVDLPGEADGRVPSEKWRNEEFAKFQDCADKEGLSLQGAVPECGFINRPWGPGDNVNLSIGQGDLAATPLQMAVAYATIANGGYVVTPHLGLRVEDDEGRALQQFEAPRREKVSIDARYRDAIMDGLRQAAQGAGGTSTTVFEGFPVPVAGKTGTAERGPSNPSQSWYMALAPADKPQYVVAVTFERGGYGAETAAPAARRILAALFNVRDDNREEAVAEARATAVE